ncbi:hypothetical protein PROFUN_16138, partial [Planoprotostelium fungivorum]
REAGNEIGMHVIEAETDRYEGAERMAIICTENKVIGTMVEESLSLDHHIPSRHVISPDQIMLAAQQFWESKTSDKKGGRAHTKPILIERQRLFIYFNSSSTSNIWRG